MSPLYTLRPITDRTVFRRSYAHSPFRASWSATREVLARELHQLRAKNVVLEIDVGERDIRADGELRADARPPTPAVRLAFDSKYGPLQYATDAFWKWQDNVRAIALGLEALRKVDRYGITRRGEQYAGWKALPPGIAAGASHMTTDEAYVVLRAAAGFTEPVDVDPVLVRRARAMSHPDRHDGDRTAWDQVEQAARVLRLA